MRLSDSRAEARFRSDLTAWLDENQPAADRASDPSRSPGHIPGWAADWQRTLFDAGWLVPRWPPELGGRDATAVEQLIYLEELARRRVPRTVNPQGLDVCAPTLADHGSGDQRDVWLPATLQGRMSWCVAVDHAEPAPPGDRADVAAGSGPSGRGLSAVERDGEVVIVGAVTAPPGTADADRCLCAVAGGGTQPIDGPLAVAIDLSAPGVTRPTDASPVLELDGVPLPDDDIVGGPDQGWPVLRSVRARVRSMRWISALLAMQRALDSLTDVGRSRGLADDGVFRDAVAGLRIEADAVRALAYRAVAKQDTGRPNPELAMLPLATARVEERIYATGLEVLGADALDMGLDGPMGWPGGSWAGEWTAAMTARAVAGGLAVERDRIAGRLLGTRLG